MYKLQKRVVAWLMLIIVTLGFSGQAATSVNAAAKELTNVQVTGLSVDHDDSGRTGNNFEYWEKFKLNVNWDASMYGNGVKAGDYFTIQLPDIMRLPDNISAKEFDIKDMKNNVVAYGRVTPAANGGGTVKVVFKDFVENKFNVKGTVTIASRFNHKKIKYEDANKIEISLNGKVASTIINMGKLTIDPEEVFYKWASPATTPDKAFWTMRINYKHAQKYTNVTISDELSTPNGNLQGMHYIEGSFQLFRVKIAQNGTIEKTYQVYDMNKGIKFNANKTAFTYDLGTINPNDQFIVYYHTSYVSGTKLQNKAKFKSNEFTKETVAHFQDSNSTGTAQLDTVGGIKIVKVDGSNKLLAGATFKVTKLADNTTMTVTTNDKGEAVLNNLTPGQYKIEEIKAPAGYKLDTTPRVINVTQGNVAVQTFTNVLAQGKIEVIKKEKGTDKKLAGAEFDVKDAAGNVVDHIITDGNGSAKSKDLPLGKYTVVETKSPSGYVLNATVQSVNVEEGKTATVTIYNEKTVAEKGKIKVRKYDARCGYPLEGAEFTVTDSKGNVVAKLVTNYCGEAVVELPVGYYTVKETKAPYGYELNKEAQSVTVKKNETVTLSFYNKQIQKNCCYYYWYCYYVCY